MVLIALAFAGVFFIIERLINLRRKQIIPAEAVIEKAAALNPGDVSGADSLYQDSPSTFTKVVSHMAEYHGSEHSVLMDSAADIAGRDIDRQNRRSYGIGVIATLAPLLGLLGTMVGMIEAFAKFAKLEDSAEAALVLGDSIGKALITTAIGLIIAIPALGVHHWLKVRMARYADELEEAIDRVSHRWFLKGQSK